MLIQDIFRCCRCWNRFRTLNRYVIRVMNLILISCGWRIGVGIRICWTDWYGRTIGLYKWTNERKMMCKCWWDIRTLKRSNEKLFMIPTKFHNHIPTTMFQPEANKKQESLRIVPKMKSYESCWWTLNCSLRIDIINTHDCWWNETNFIRSKIFHLKTNHSSEIHSNTLFPYLPDMFIIIFENL